MARYRFFVQDPPWSVDHGSVIYRDATGYRVLAPSTAGRVLTTNGIGADPTWDAPSATVGDGDKGDLTVSGGGTTWTIDNGAVTLAKMQAIDTQRVLGRDTAGTGAVEQVGPSAILDWIGSTRGSILYRGASGWAVATPGASGEVWTSAGPGADPSWQAASGGGLTAAQAYRLSTLIAMRV